jgi:hypothetical protein
MMNSIAHWKSELGAVEWLKSALQDSEERAILLFYVLFIAPLPLDTTIVPVWLDTTHPIRSFRSRILGRSLGWWIPSQISPKSL